MLSAVGLDLGRAPVDFFLFFFEPRPSDDFGPFSIFRGVDRVPEGCSAGGAVGGEEPDAVGPLRSVVERF